jgi:hypothetical protein
MKLTINTVAFDIAITDEAGQVIFAHSGENIRATLDVAGGLAALSALAHQFKALDSTHSVADTQGERERQPRVGISDRSPQVQELIDAVRRFNSCTNSINVELSCEQHDGYMALADALRNACDDASAANVKVLADRARAYIALFPVGQFVVVRDRLTKAIAAV